MKILLLAPQENETLGYIGSYAQKTLREMGHEVSRFDFRERPYSKNKFVSALKSRIRLIFPALPSPYALPAIKLLTDQKINTMLLDRVASERPDMLLVFLGENITPETLAMIRARGVVCVNWILDTLLLPNRAAFLRQVLNFYDHVFIVDSLRVLDGLAIAPEHIRSLSLGCYQPVHKRVELSKEEASYYGSDIAFVGTLTPEREKMLESLSDLDLKIWGRWEKESPLLKKAYRKKDIRPEEMVKVYNASKIVLDIHSCYGVEKEFFNVSPRVFEVPACGGFLLTNQASVVGDLYVTGEEMVIYRDLNHLKDLIRHYLDHPQERQALAQKAFEKVHRQHTYAHRLNELIKIVNGAASHTRPPVSVVIPCYNGKELLKKNLPPLIKSLNVAADEIIIVNDASTDGIVEFIREFYPFINLISLEKNKGYSCACNIGIEKSRHDLVMLMNTDVEVTDGFLEPLARHFKRKDIFAVCSIEVHDESLTTPYALPVVDFKFGFFWYKYQPISGPLKDAVPVLFAEGACTLYDKQKFLALGCHDLMLSPLYWEDMDVCFRAWKRGWQSLYEPRSLHWHHSQSTISKKHRKHIIQTFHWKNRYLFMWKNIDSPSLILQHILFLPFILALSPFLGKPEVTLGFFHALKQLPEALRQKPEGKKGQVLRDVDIIKKFRHV